MATPARVLPFSARRQILPTLDLRTPEQRRGITQTQQTMQALASILQIIGQAEKIRRERQTLDRVARAVGTLKEGSTIAEAIANITSATQQQPQFGTGLQGILQKIGGGFQPPGGGGVRQNILQAIIGQKLKQTLTPPIQEKPFTLSPGQKRFTGAGERVTGVPKTAPRRTSANIIADINRIGTAIGKAKDDPGLKSNLQREIDNLHNELIEVRQRDFPEVVGPEYRELFDEVIEGQPREKREDSWFDKVYGSKAYRAAKRAYIKQVAQKYKTSPKRAIQQFDKIWLEKYQAEAGERFQKFGQPSAFGQEEGTEQEIPTQLAEPQSKEEFLKTVQSIEDEDEAEAYYNKWISKWQ